MYHSPMFNRDEKVIRFCILTFITSCARIAKICGKGEKLNRKQIIVIPIVLLLSFIVHNQTQGLDPTQRSTLVIIVIAIVLWFTEAVPLSTTALLVPILQVFLRVQGLQEALSPFFSPTVMLLFGGFMLTRAIEKHGVDEYIAYLIVSRAKSGFRFLVLSIMMVTGFLSMWISNTASAALLITMGLKITRGMNDKSGNVEKIMVLAVAHSATAGGVSTLIGTTTTAMAAASLGGIGYDMGFMEWMGYGFPVTLILTLISWVTLFILFPTTIKEVPPIEREFTELTPKQKHTILVFALAVLAWLTGRLPDPIANLIGFDGHGYSSAFVAGVVVLVLSFSGIVEERDLKEARWPTLLLIGGGLSLGAAMEASGLTIVISDLIVGASGGGHPLAIIALIVFAGSGVSILMSNTASAGIILPIAISLADTTGMSPVILAAVVGIGSSMDFMLPIGTPPNAIAYSTGKVSMKEMIKAGALLDLAGTVCTILLAYLLWPYVF